MIRLGYLKERQLARLETDQEDDPLWLEIKRLLRDYGLKDCDQGSNYLELPWWNFRGKWPEVDETLK